MQTLWQDVRYAARMLLKQPGFTLVAISTLALGIGANTAIFSVISAVLLEPLPFAAPEQLVHVWNTEEKNDRFEVSYPDFADWRAQNQSFERMAAWTDANFTLTGTGDPLNLRGTVVTADLFPLLGVAPQIGRNFLAEEDRPGGRAVILSHHLWQQRFGADPNLSGKTIIINDQRLTVAGVMPAGFAFPIQNSAIDLWVSAAWIAEGQAPLTEQRGNHAFGVIGRLRQNVALGQAQAEMNAIVSHLAQQYPETNKFGVRIAPLHEDLVGEVRLVLLILFGAVGCVLLIACANVANLLLARATTRHREMAVRAALGASRLRVVRQLLTESVLLSLCGGIAGLLLALWGTDLLLALVPEGLPRASEAGLDARVFGFTVMVSLLTGIVFGLVPALQAVKFGLTEALKEGSKGAGQGARRHRVRDALIVTEIALALVLLVCAGLLINSFLRLQRVDPGFDSQGVLTFRTGVPSTRYSQKTQVTAFYRQLIARLETLPGVTSVSAVDALPLSGAGAGVGFSIEGMALAPNNPFPYESGLRAVVPGYFRTMGMQLIKGRDFTARDDSEATQVAIINETLARRYFPNEDPIGKRINPSFATDKRGVQMREIVGIFRDVKHESLSAAPQPEVYVAHGQLPSNSMNIVMRTTIDPNHLIAAARNEVHLLDQDLPVFNIKTLDQYKVASVAEPRFNSTLLGIFAGLALILTAVGIYGVMAYAVTQRTHEVGLRMALGAQRGDVLRLVIKQGLLLTVIGVAIGLAGALAMTRVLASLLYGVTATDPLTFVSVALLLIIIGVLACYIPARRATRVDPLEALRHE